MSEFEEVCKKEVRYYRIQIITIFIFASNGLFQLIPALQASFRKIVGINIPIELASLALFLFVVYNLSEKYRNFMSTLEEYKELYQKTEIIPDQKLNVTEELFSAKIRIRMLIILIMVFSITLVLRQKTIENTTFMYFVFMNLAMINSVLLSVFTAEKMMMFKIKFGE